MKQIVILKTALTEIADAISFYDERKAGLGDRLLTELEHALHRIGRHPRVGELIDDQHRRQLLNRFPFAVLYSEEPLRILVVALMHQQRRPKYWINR